MNDILLTHGPDPGTWDWSFGLNDVNVVRGNMQLINAVKHAVLLHPNELIQDAYIGKGCTIHDYIYTGNTEAERELEAGAVETTAKSVDGVYDAQCTIASTDEYEASIQLKLITEDMEEVTVDGI